MVPAVLKFDHSFGVACSGGEGGGQVNTIIFLIFLANYVDIGGLLVSQNQPPTLPISEIKVKVRTNQLPI